MASVLIIEDDITFAHLLDIFLKKQWFEVTMAHDIKTGKKLLGEKSYDILLLDYRLPDGSGMEVLTWLRDRDIQTRPVIMTSFHDVGTAVKTIRLGAYDYITKPVNPDELLLAIQDVQNRNNAPVAGSGPQYLKGSGKKAQKLNEYIELVAPTDFSVIIQGDSGTGKELAARNIHRLSKRSNAPFIALDCGALSSELAGSELFGHVKGAFTGAHQNKQGHFEEADGGTLFLDEVGNLNYEVQVKLLRALQEHEIHPVGSSRQIKIDVRIICATNDNLFNAVRNGKFREDLYHRLNEFSIHVPALIECREDIPLFADHFIKQTNNELGKQVKGIADEVLGLFLIYDWPGNLRELKNIVRRAVLLTPAGEITMDAIPSEMTLSVQQQHASGSDTDLKVLQEISERALIIKTLEQVKHNKAKAARLLNIDRSTLYYKMTKYSIN